ncbi:MAG: DUF2079 domain-containing protein [Planctomycetaceae bacterium]
MSTSSGRWLLAGLMVVLGTTCAAFMTHTILEDPLLSHPYASETLWQRIVEAFGGSVSLSASQRLTAMLPSGPLYATVWTVSLLLWAGGAVWLRRIGVGAFNEMLLEWGIRGWRWGLLWGGWSAAWVASLLLGWTGGVVFLARSSPLWMAVFINLWGAEWFALRRRAPAIRLAPPSDSAQKIRQGWRAVWVASGLFALTFTAMNWGLWFNLQVPHGDSAMYEEHLWNLEHGKGFRSYLDQGLFLGEHIQVVHALLIPLHLLWPSQLLLEMCEAIALALTAIPVYRIALRHSGSPRAAAYLAMSVLLYFPLQYLDITIDLKTFRPNAFGVPLLLAAIDQLEVRKWRGMTVFAVLTLTAQEDFAIPLALIGFWLAIVGPRATPGEGDESESLAGNRRVRIIGGLLCLASTAYLLFVMKVALPWFREGVTIHYASYFTRFGQTPGEILQNLILKPGLLWNELVDAPTFLYAMYLLAPLGFLPLLSPSRLLIAAPLFVLLCLNELAQDPPGPFHHFHASLLPILFWAAAAGLQRLRPRPSPSRTGQPRVCSGIQWNTAVCGARFALGSALLGSLCYTLTPLGVRFWDAGRIVASRPTYWRSLYLPDERARAWAMVAPLIPMSAHVAATDFVHARLTHCTRSYDYSRYVRRVAGYEDRVPDDTDFIVIDLRHPYSRSVLGDVQSSSDVRELREHPDHWELLTSPQDPYFVVLKRRTPAPAVDPELAPAQDK